MTEKLRDREWLEKTGRECNTRGNRSLWPSFFASFKAYSTSPPTLAAGVAPQKKGLSRLAVTRISPAWMRDQDGEHCREMGPRACTEWGSVVGTGTLFHTSGISAPRIQGI